MIQVIVLPKIIYTYLFEVVVDICSCRSIALQPFGYCKGMDAYIRDLNPHGISH